MENMSLKVVRKNYFSYYVYIICNGKKFMLCEMYEHDLGCVGFKRINADSDYGVYLINANHNELNPLIKYQIDINVDKPYELEFDFNKVYQELANGKLKVKKFKFTKWAIPLFIE